MHNDDDAPIAALNEWCAARKPAALATVVSTWGSSPRPEGSHLAVDAEGHFVGSVSGGCIEGAVIEVAQEAMHTRQPRLLEFGVSDEQAWQVGLACGGRVLVYVEGGGLDEVAARIAAARAQRRGLVTLTRLADGTRWLLTDDDAEGSLALAQAALAEARACLATGRSGRLESDPELFARAYVPAPRLLIVGAVHIAQALAGMAATAGFEVVVIDPRGAFASPARFPGVQLSAEWPDEALARLSLDSATALVALSHDPKLDDPALQLALPSKLFYIGALGSRRTHEKRVQRLTEAGLGEYLSRIHSPIGLDLGGRAPAEIAVSILAEIIRVRYKGAA
jgi:xanthine dehydrogenase accessory factor